MLPRALSGLRPGKPDQAPIHARDLPGKLRALRFVKFVPPLQNVKLSVFFQQFLQFPILHDDSPLSKISYKNHTCMSFSPLFAQP